MSNYFFELAIIHSALILGYWIFLRKEQAHTHLRIYLLGSTLLALIIPLIKLPKLFTSSPQPLLGPAASPLPQDFATITVVADIPAWYEGPILWIYLAISIFLFCKCLWGIYYIFSLKRHSISEKVGDVSILKVSNMQGSFTFFKWIFLSQDIEQNERDYEVILQHEKAHSSMGHSFDLLFFEFFRICFWWLPSAWFINREIKTIHEYQADAQALKSSSIDHYSSILINTTLKINGLSLASSLHDGLILKRIKAMKNSSKKMNAWKLGLLGFLSAFLFLAFACSEEPDPSSQLAPNQDDVFTVVEEHAEYPGGMEGLYKYVAGEIRYPKAARSQSVEGQVWVQFVVERDGSLSNVKTTNGIGGGCDKEAVRVLESVKSFTPAKQRGRTVRVRMAMPLTFKLKPGKTNPDQSTQGSVIVGKVNYVYSNLQLDAKYYDGAWTGTVKDEDMNPLPGTSIMIPGTTKGTVSDLDGTFTLKAEKSQEVQVRFIGYETLKLATE